MKHIAAIMIVFMAGCGAEDTGFIYCDVDNYSINLGDQSSCMLSEQHALANDLQPGLIECKDEYFSLNGSQYASGAIFGQSFYGLTVYCAAADKV